MSAIRGNWWNVPASIPIKHNCVPFPSCAPLPHNESLALLKPHGCWSARVHRQSSRNMQTGIRRAAPSGWTPTALPGPITWLQAWRMQAACGMISHIVAWSHWLDGRHQLSRPGCAFVTTGAFKPPPPLTLLSTNTPLLPLSVKASRTHRALKKRKLATSALT